MLVRRVHSLAQLNLQDIEDRFWVTASCGLLKMVQRTRQQVACKFGLIFIVFAPVQYVLIQRRKVMQGRVLGAGLLEHVEREAELLWWKTLQDPQEGVYGVFAMMMWVLGQSWFSADQA